MSHVAPFSPYTTSRHREKKKKSPYKNKRHREGFLVLDFINRSYRGQSCNKLSLRSLTHPSPSSFRNETPKFLR